MIVKHRVNSVAQAALTAPLFAERDYSNRTWPGFIGGCPASRCNVVARSGVFKGIT